MSAQKMSNTRLGSVLGLLATGLLAAGAVVAQSATNNTLTSSTSRTPDTFEDIVLAPIRVDLYETRLLGLLQGDPTLYYDQTFAAPFGDPIVGAGVTAAMMALTTANSGNSLSFLGPTFDGSTPSFLFSNTVFTPIGSASITSIQLEDTIGPGTILVDERGLCAGFGANGYVYGCAGGSSFEVLLGTANLNVNSNSQYLFTGEVQRTDSYRISDT